MICPICGANLEYDDVTGLYECPWCDWTDDEAPGDWNDDDDWDWSGMTDDMFEDWT